MIDEFFKKVNYTKKEAANTGRRLQHDLDRAFEAGNKVADKTAEVAAPALDEAERMAGEMDGFMGHDPGMGDPAEPVDPALEEDDRVMPREEDVEPMDANNAPVEPVMDEDPFLPDADSDLSEEEDERDWSTNSGGFVTW